MAIKIFNRNQHSREEWLEMRRQGIGGSDAAAIIGLSPWTSQLALWADKQGLMPEKETSEAMRIGTDLEDYTARRWMEKAEKRCRATPYTYAHDDHPYIFVDVDREVVGENAGLECKTTNPRNPHDFAGGEIPLYYAVQCYHTMIVRNYDRMYLAVLVMGVGFYDYVIERNQAEIDALLTAEINWWQAHMIQGKQPAPDGTESSQTAVDTITGKLTRPETKPLYETSGAAERYCKLKTDIAELEKQAEAAKQEIELAMGDAEAAETFGHRISYKLQSRTSLDGKAIAADHPDIYCKYIRTTQSRVFRITEIKQK